MKDGIIKGTGNSRYLKGSGWPATYEEFKSMAEAGTLPFDLNGINETGWQQIGDALSKANLLTDAVATLWGGSSASKVTDILKYAAARYGTCATASATSAKVVTLSNFVLSIGAVIGVSFTYTNTAVSPTLNVNGTGTKSIYCNGSLALATQISKMAYFQYDGTYWQLLNEAVIQHELFSYVGTGTYGISNPCNISFSRPVKMFWLFSQKTSGMFYALQWGTDGTAVTTVVMSELTENYTRYIIHLSGPTDVTLIKKSADNKSVQYYSSDAASQFNNSGAKYFGIAFY